MIFIKFKVIFLFLIISSITAISNVQVEPTEPNVGDTVTLSGTANPNEEITIQAEFNVNPIVSYPYYGYKMYDVNIPNTPNNFKVIGENVNDLSISVKMGMWITKSATANNEGIAIVSKSDVPPGTYDMVIGGKIKDESKPVNLKIIASTTIKADKNGNFKYTYNTNSIPDGTTVYLNIGGITKEITLSDNIPIPPTINLENNSDSTPPKITIYYPTISTFNYSKLNYKFSVNDNSDYIIKVYLNDNLLNPHKNNNEYSGTILLKEGENYLKIIAKDNYSNENIKVIKLQYNPNMVKDSENNNNNNNVNTINDKNVNINNNDNKNNNNIFNDTNNVNINNNDNKNIVYGMVIKKTGNATLIISDGTEIYNSSEEISLLNVNIKNITQVYLIKPTNAKFSKEITLKINIDGYNNNSEIISVLRYDNMLKKWISIPYTLNNNTVIINTKKSGYYAVNIKERIIQNKSFIDETLQIISNIKNIVFYLLSKLLNII